MASTGVDRRRVCERRLYYRIFIVPESIYPRAIIIHPELFEKAHRSDYSLDQYCTRCDYSRVGSAILTSIYCTHSGVIECKYIAPRQEINKNKKHDS